MSVNSSPEEAAGKLDQKNAVDYDLRSPWQNSENMWTFQNYDDLEEYGPEIVSGGATPVLVIDNEDAVISYGQNKHYYVLAELDYGSTVQVTINHLTEYFSILVEEGSATLEEVNGPIDFIGKGAIKIDSYQGYPIYIRDPAIDDSRPETQTGSTTSSSTGNTVKTTTTAKIGAAGVVTESETTPAPSPTSRLDSKGATPGLDTGQSPAQPSSRLDSKGATPSLNTGEALAALARGAKTSVDPCLPNNPPASQVQGNGATPPATANPLDAFGGAGAAVSRATSGANPLDAFGGAGPNIPTQTAPTTVTQQPSTPTSGPSTTPTNSSANVYVYEPLTPGFDRYDFNSGKKVFTPNGGGPSTPNGTTPAAPQSTPNVTPAVNVDTTDDARAARTNSTVPGAQTTPAAGTPSTGVSNRAVQPVGRVSSARIPGQGPNIRPGDETNALDAIAARTARFNGN